MGPIVSAVATALSGVLATAFGLFANILGIISGAFLWLSVNIFNWVLSPDFISLSFTDPAKNPFLEVGWGLTRDFANIIIVLALVVIGLGTALRLAGYQAQKALPSLILIALLINFTPVICGLIVDASNILMSFFVGEGFAGGNSFINASISQWANISSLVGGLKLWDPIASQEAIAAAIGSYISAFFNFYAAVIYLIFALLFILRYIAIWVLVILSPLAFACYILPDTRKVWSQWWQQFIQWSFIGVIGAFFLYLGDHFLMVTKSTNFIQSTLQEVGSAPGLSAILNNIMPYGIALVFLTIGLMLTLSTSAAGASQIISWAKKGAPKAGKWMGDRGKAFVRAKTPEAVRRWAERQATAKKFGEGEKGFTGWAKRTLDTPRAFTRHVMGGVMAGALSERSSMAEAHKKAKERSMRANQMEFAKATDAERVEIMRAEREKGRLPKFVEGLQEKHVFGAFEKAISLDDKDMADAIARSHVSKDGEFAAILDKIGKPGEYKDGLSKKDRDRNLTSYSDKLFSEATTEDKWKDFEDEAYGKTDSKGVRNIEHIYTSPSFGTKQYGFASLHHGPEFENAYAQFGQEKDKDYNWHLQNAPRALQNYTSRPNQSGSRPIWPGIDEKRINQDIAIQKIAEKYPNLTSNPEYYRKHADLNKKLNSNVLTRTDKTPIAEQIKDEQLKYEERKGKLTQEEKDALANMERINKYNPLKY